MTSICIVSSVGGAGRTTITAQLSERLHARGHSTLAVDLDPQNMLGLHLGMSPTHIEGWSNQLQQSADPGLASQQSRSGAPYIPHGFSDNLSEKTAASALSWIGGLVKGSDKVFLFDSPRLPNALSRSVMDLADIVIAVLPTTPAAFARLDLLAHLPSKTYYVLNAYDATQRLHSDLQALMLESVGNKLLEQPIHRDQSVAEAFAQGKSLQESAPQSQAGQDLDTLTIWLEERLTT